MTAPITSVDSQLLDPARHPAAIASAIGTQWRTYRWRGYAVGLLAAVLAAGVVAPILTTTVIMATAASGGTVPTRIPWDAIVWSTVFALAAPWSSAATFSRWQPRRFRDAVETYLWLAIRAEQDFQRLFGAASVPRDERSIRAFLSSAAETPETAVERAGMWLAILEIDRARAVADAIPDATPGGRFDRAATRWLADFIAGTTRSLEPIERLIEMIPDSDDRLEASALIALSHARVALAEARDWRSPLASVRQELGAEPHSTYRRVVWLPVFRRLLSVYAIGVVIYWVAFFALDPFFALPGR